MRAQGSLRELQSIFQRVAEKEPRGIDDLHSFQQHHAGVCAPRSCALSPKPGKLERNAVGC